VETQSGRKPQNTFSYMSLRIKLIGRINFLCFPSTTGRRIEPEGRSNSPILWIQQEGGYKPLVFQATT
jgi:hypothetical protein